MPITSGIAERDLAEAAKHGQSSRLGERYRPGMLRSIAAVAFGAALLALTGGAASGYRLAIEWPPTPPQGCKCVGATVSRVDPLSLTRLGRTITLGELHAGLAVSPDGSRVAFGISAPARGGGGRIGIRVVDLRRWKVVANIKAGIAAEALWWPSARRLVAVLQRGPLIVANPATAKVVRRVSLPLVPDLGLQNRGAVVTSGGFVVLLHDPDAVGPATVALITVDGSVRTITLDRIPVDNHHAGRATLAASGNRVIVVGDGVAAEIDPTTLAVAYHHLTAPASDTELLHAVAVADSTVAVSGRHADGSPSGLDLLDTTTWQVRHLEDEADSVAGAGGVVLTYGRHKPGVRGYRADGDEAFAILGGETVSSVFTAGGTAYVRTGTSIAAIDAASGKILRLITPSRPLVGIVDGRARPKAALPTKRIVSFRRTRPS
jgi:hypothetical protein